MQATSIATGYLILSALSVCILAVLIFLPGTELPWLL